MAGRGNADRGNQRLGSYQVYVHKHSAIRIVLATALISAHATAFGESDGRIAPRLTRNWQPPTVEDADAFLAALPSLTDNDGEDETAVGNVKFAIASVTKVLNSNSDKRTRFKLQHRLASLYLMAAIENRRSELDDYKAELTKYFTEAKDSKEPPVDHSRSQTFLIKALDTYRNLLSAAPAYHARGDVALNVGRILARLGSPNAIPDLTKVTSDFPKSGYADRAKLLIAELQLKSPKSSEDGESLLTSLNKSKDKSLRAYAKYRSAWTEIKLAPSATSDENGFGGSDSTTTAITTMREIAARECRGTPSAAHQILCRQINDDLVFLFGNSQQIPVAESYFKARHDQDRFHLTLERSAGIYLKGRKFHEAGLVLKKLIHDAPSRDQTPWSYLQLVDTQRRAENPAAAAESFEQMSRDCIRAGGSWVKAHAANKTLLSDARELFGKVSAETAVAFIRENKEKGLSEYLSASNRIFATHLAAFPDGPESEKLRYLYADGLNSEEKPAEAAYQYMIVARDAEPSSKLKTRAAERMLALQLEVSGPAPSVTPEQWATLKAPDPLAKIDTQLVAASDTYGKIFPSKKISSELALRSAALYLSHGYPADALTRVKSLALGSPASPSSTTGIGMLLSYHNTRREWDDSIKISTFFSEQESLKKSPVQGKIGEAWRFALWSKASDLTERKEFASAGRTFTTYAETFATDKLADQALVNASVAWLKLGNGEEGLKPCHSLIANYGKSPLRPVCLLSIASVSEQKLEYSGAAEAYTQLAEAVASNADRATEAWMRSAELYADDHNFEFAAQNLRKLLGRYPTHARAASALFRLGQVEASRGEIEKAIAAYDRHQRSYLATHPSEALLAASTAAVLQIEKNPADARRRAEKAGKLVVAAAPNVGLEARAILAAYQFEIVRAARERFTLSPIDETNFTMFSKSLASIRSEIKSVESAYQNVIQLGDSEYTVASRYQLGLIYEQAINAIKAAPSSGAMSGSELTNAVNQRETAILEFKTAMNNHWEQGVKTVQTGDHHNRWLRLTRAKLAQMSPSRFVDHGEIMLKPVFTSHVITSDMTETN